MQVVPFTKFTDTGSSAIRLYSPELRTAVANSTLSFFLCLLLPRLPAFLGITNSNCRERQISDVGVLSPWIFCYYSVHTLMQKKMSEMHISFSFFFCLCSYFSYGVDNNLIPLHKLALPSYAQIDASNFSSLNLILILINLIGQIFLSSQKKH